MKVRFRNIIIFSFLFFFNFPIFGQFIKPAPTYFFPQHIRPSDPAMAALGYTGTAHRDGLFASFSNPAGLINIDRFEIAYTHLPSHKMSYFPSMVSEDFFGQYTFSLAIPINQYLKVGLYYFNLHLGETGPSIFAPSNTEKEDFGIRQFQLSFSTKVNVNEKFAISFGSNIKYLQDLYNYYDGNVLLFDLGCRSEWTGEKTIFSLGAVFTNIGSKIKYEVNSFSFEEDAIKLFKMAMAIRSSTLYQKESGNTYDYMFTIEYQKSINAFWNNAWKTLSGGLELTFFSHLFGQIGYIYDLRDIDPDSEFKGLTYGFGFETPENIDLIIPIKLSLSYGHGIKQGLLDSNIISISISSNFN